MGNYLFDLIASEGKKDVAREMLRVGEPNFRVMQYTKLDKDTVLQLQEEVGEPDGVLIYGSVQCGLSCRRADRSD